MAVAIYKPGQGYWVRVMTAVFAGALVLATAAWAASQASLIRPPVSGYDTALAGVESSAAPGDTVELLRQDRTPIGRATVVSTELTGPEPTLRFANPELEESTYLSDVQRLRTQGGFTAAVAGQPRTAFAFSQVYLQGGFAGVVLLIGAILIYWHVAVRRPSVDFLVNTDNEMKKVNWSTRREVIGSTWVVVAATFLISAALFVVDYLFSSFFGAVGVLQTG